MAEIDVKDSVHLLTLLPDVVWTRVIEETSRDHSTLKRLSHSAKFFRNRLSSQRVYFLFDKAFPLFENLLYYQSAELKEHQHGKICGDCARSRKVQEYSTILSLRQTCKSWKNVVDTSLEKAQQNKYVFSHDYHNITDKNPLIEETTTEIYSLGDWPDYTTEFDKHFRKTQNSNPFLTHAARFFIDQDSYGSSPYAEEKQTDVDRVSSLYGHYLRYCTIDITVHYTPFYCFRHLYPLLQNLPNLQRLELIMDPQFPVDDLEEPCLSMMNEQIESLGVWPNLPKLELLIAMDLPCKLLEAIFQANPHIRAVDINRISRNIIAEALPHAANLEDISLTFFSVNCFKYLSSLGERKSLKKLQCILHHCMTHNWSEVFLELEQNLIGNALTDLTIVIPPTYDLKDEAKIMEECNSYALCMPNLKRLQIVIPNISTLDFIFPLASSLEVLDLEVGFNLKDWQMENDERVWKLQENQKIKFLGYVDKFKESNIWELFPLLQKVICREYYPQREIGKYPDWNKRVDVKHIVFRPRPLLTKTQA